MSPTIRRAGITDAPAVAEIYVETWREAYPGMLPDTVLLGMSREHQRRAWRHSICDPAQSVLLAQTEGGDIVGFGSCGATRRPSVPFSGEIYTLYVRPEHQDRGIGRRLMAAAFAAMVEKGYSRSFLWVLRDNPSRYFYDRIGGQPVAQRRERLWGCSLDETCYGWTDLTQAVAKLGSCETG